MQIKASTTYTINFVTNDSTGAAADADSTPSASLYANNTDTSLTVTVAAISGKTGCYSASFTTGANISSFLGKTAQLLIEATVDSVASKAFVPFGQFSSKLIDDLNDIDGSSVTVSNTADCKATGFAVAGDAMTLTEAYDAAKSAASSTDVSNSTVSINAQVNANETKIDTLTDNVAIVDSLVDGICSELDSTPLNTLAQPGDAMTLTSAYDAAKTAAERLTANRAGYIDKLNIGEDVIANTGNADSFKADVSGLSTFDPASDEVIANITKVNDVAVTDIDDFKATDVTATVDEAAVAAAVAEEIGLDDLTNILEADKKVVQTAGGWEKVYYLKGTSTVLLRKALLQADGTPVTDFNTTVGQEIDNE